MPCDAQAGTVNTVFVFGAAAGRLRSDCFYFLVIAAHKKAPDCPCNLEPLTRQIDCPCINIDVNIEINICQRDQFDPKSTLPVPK